MSLPVLMAWGVHLYTACGLVLAAGMVGRLNEATPEAFRQLFLLMVLATFIDATDGWLARRCRVKERVPGFDGRRLDDITDFLTYTFIPLWLIWRADLLSPHAAWWLCLPLLASAYGFCQSQAKTEDGYFLGFPSYWNVVAFYLYYLRPSASLALAVLLTLAALTFVPLRYLYPSMPGKLNRWTIALAVVWAGMLLVFLLWPDAAKPWVLVASLAFPVYYLGASWMVSARICCKRT